ncbi:hypothetical protein ACFQ5D_06430 [Paenibacillus farraposensis]|uniref:Uncharacterized protein n=1 Tax=Paenibacillus farraposensis TaxID=2807095 RepID=A0ABW4DBF4_9BACL|nr:hypothetical protein [Paenibacillus farraposensis]MCC3381458.1 hypothetical protein [Paenibacillus farraposensis]
MISSVIAQNELSLVKSYLLLSFIQKVLERDSLILEESGATYINKGNNKQFSMAMPAFRKEMYERMRAYLGLPTSIPHTATFPLPEKHRPDFPDSHLAIKPLRFAERNLVTPSPAYKRNSLRPAATATNGSA